MNPLFIAIIVILTLGYLFDTILDYLNLRMLSSVLPEGGKEIYDEQKYRESQDYYRANQYLSFVSGAVGFIALLLMLFFNGFALIDTYVRTWTSHPTLVALLFFAILGILSDLLNLPFALYRIFVIEEKFGFNKTTLKTFIMDKLKGYLLGAIIGGILLTAIMWIYQSTGENFWLLAWGVLSVFTIFMTMFYTTLIVPLFNKLTPLPIEELRQAIESYCEKVSFSLRDLFVIDNSKRSTKANAFFSGFGSEKKIVLYDTLIDKHPTEELIAVLAHEVGHYKRKHVIIGVLLGILQTGLMLWIFSQFLGNSELSQALGIAHHSFHINLVAFVLLYTPVAEVLGIAFNIIKRKHEFEADAYAKQTYSGPAMQKALKKLAAENLSNLTPHPAYVFVHYSHPPVLQRIQRLETSAS